MRIRLLPWLFISTAFVICSCERYPTIPDNQAMQPPPQTAQPLPPSFENKSLKPATAAMDYRIGPEDVLEIKVWNHDDLSREAQVSQSGEFTFPLIGRVEASGRTTVEVEKEITRRLGEGYLVEPQISVSVRDYRSQKVYVLGEVRTPGSYALTGPTSVMEMLSRAGGATQNAGSEVLVIRPREGNRRTGPIVPEEAEADEVIKLNLRALQEGEVAQKIGLANGDTVVVSKALYYYVLGEVRRPGQFPYQEGLTVLKAITIAGGITDKGSARRTRVIREKEGARKERPVRMSDLVTPNDIIMVPESFF